MMAGGVSQDFGDVENIECPSPDQHNAYEIVGEMQGAVGRVSTTLTGRYAMNVASDLLRLAKKRCRVDAVIVYGDCTDPSSYNTFSKAKHISGARFTSHGTEDEGSLTSGDNATVNESADISGADQYEVMPLSFTRKADSLVTNEVVDVVICDDPSCGECDDESDGCERVYAVSIAHSGSPAGGADVIYTIDGGAAWNTSFIDSPGAGEDPTGIACLNGYVVVISADSNSLHYVLQSELDATGDETWVEVETGFVAAHGPRDIWSTGRYAFIAANGGYIYGTDDPTAGVTVLNAAEATDPTTGAVITADMLAIHALSDTFAVAVGEEGYLMKTENQTTWTGLTRFVAVGVDLTAVWLIDEKTWWVGTNTGRLYYTVDGGDNWTEKTFTGSGAGRIDDVAFSNDAVGYVAHATASPRGRILRTHSGGGGSGEVGGWYILPETGKGTMPYSDRFNALAACKHDVNFVVGVGLADDGADGIIVLGED